MERDHAPQSRCNVARAFAILDALYVVLHVHRLPHIFSAAMHADLVSILLLVVDGMLCFSAMAWWRQSKRRFVITYILFPFRVLIGAFSLSYFADIAIAVLPSNYTVHYSVWGTACAADVIRLIYTIRIQLPARHSTASDGIVSLHAGHDSMATNPYYPPLQR